MASSVFYKFKSQKDESRVTFDGTGISVFDLKRDIILANNLGKANDCDLVVSDSSSGQGQLSACVHIATLLNLFLRSEYKDDSQIIPRSSSVIVKRLPSARPGKGKAAMYIAGVGNSALASDPSQKANGSTTWHKGAMSKRFDIKEEPPSSITKPLVVRI
jgi:protein MPE1